MSETLSAPSLRPIFWLRDRLAQFADNRLFAYCSIFALQLKVIWDIWRFKDLPFGDTASYYVLAQAWHLIGADMIVWSPLYTTFLGTFLFISPDPYFATIAHRAVIVLALAVLVLALMRRLLSPIVAWCIAAWWVVLPINFDSLYDVHIFFVVLILLLYLVVLALPGLWARGAGVAMLLALSVLMRNELVVPLIVFAGIALGFDLWRCFRQRTVQMRRILLAYGAPLIAALLLAGFFYDRSLYKWPVIERFISHKHTLNVCQIYAVSYQQQHPEWTKSPWTECRPLILATFGKPEVTLLEAFRLNPRAMVGYFWWNIKLIPSGLQVLLFNVAAGSVNPDYAPVTVNPPRAMLGSFLLIGILAWGSVIFFRDRRQQFEISVRPNVWGWIVMACVASVVVVIMITERPRPSYMFTLGLLLMALTGICVQLIVGRLGWMTALRPIFPIAAIAAIACAPCYYHSPRFGSRPNLDVFRRMQPFQEMISPDMAIIGGNAGAELCFYLSRIPDRYCTGISYWSFRDSVPPGADWNQALAARKVKFFMANELVMSDKAAAAFIESAPAHGWQVAEVENVPGNRWLLLRKP